MAVYPQGIVASSTGAYRGVSGVPILTSRSVWYVSSTHARASNTNIGSEPEEPFLTLAQAITDSSAGDIIMVMAGHVDAAADHDLNKDGLLVIGQGSSTTKPQFPGSAASDASTFTLSKAGTMIRNLRIWQAENDGNTPVSLVDISITGCAVEDCQLNQGTDRAGDDQAESGPSAILLSGTAARATIRNNSFIKRTVTEAASGSSQSPQNGVLFSVIAAGTKIIGNTFDGGTVGYDLGAVHVPNGIACVDLYLQGNTFSNGADVLTAGTGSIRFWGYGNTFDVGSRFQNDSNRFRIYENGLTSDEVGHAGLTTAGLIHSGDIYFLDSSHSSSSNSAAGNGTIRNRPLATLAQAITNATGNNGDIIVIEKGHRETLTAQLVVETGGITILGMGSGDDRALFTLANTPGPPETAPANMLDVQATDVWLGNFRVTSTVDAASHSELIEVQAAGCIVDAIGFDQTKYDATALMIGASGVDAWVRSNTFTRSALPLASTENHAIVLAHTAEGYTLLEDNSLDPTSDYFWGATTRLKGGITDAAAMGSVHILGTVLLNGADVFMQNTTRIYLIADSVQNAGSSGHT